MRVTLQAVILLITTIIWVGCTTAGTVSGLELQPFSADASMAAAGQMVAGSAPGTNVSKNPIADQAEVGGQLPQKKGGTGTIGANPDIMGEPAATREPIADPTPSGSQKQVPLDPKSNPQPSQDTFPGTYTFIDQNIVVDNCAGRCAQITMGTVIWTVTTNGKDYIIANNGRSFSGSVSGNYLTFDIPPSNPPPENCSADRADAVKLSRSGTSASIHEAFHTTLNCSGREAVTCACEVEQTGSFVP